MGCYHTKSKKLRKDRKNEIEMSSISPDIVEVRLQAVSNLGIEFIRVR